MATHVTPDHLGAGGADGAGELQVWRDSARVVLQPSAASSILGLFGLTAATFMVAAQLAGWYGNSHSAVYLAPFAALFGGATQFGAGLWAHRTRDAVATAAHGVWGSFWIAYGILFLLVAVGAVTVPSGTFVELGYSFIALATITLSCGLASLGHNLAIAVTLLGLAAGAALLAIGYLTGIGTWLHVGGYDLIADACCAFYAGSAMLLTAAPERPPRRRGRIVGA